MSFFIDEINLFSSIDLFKVKPDYQVRDEIETKISTILPYKHTINVEESNIKVELFHSDITDAQLEEIEKVINDTFKLCQKYKIVPNNTDFNFRIFLFEDREQYDDVRKVYLGREEDTSDEMGLTISKLSEPFALPDVLMKFLPSSEINYLTLSHEFVHCMQEMTKHKDLPPLKLLEESTAMGISCELLDENVHNTPCQKGIMDGIKTVFAKDIRFINNSPSDLTESDNYSVGLVMFNFLQDQHPEIISKIYENYLTGGTAKLTNMWQRLHCVDSEFRYWLLDTTAKKIRSQDKINYDLEKEILRDIEEHSCTQNPEFKNIVDKLSKMYSGTHETLEWAEQILETYFI